MFITAGTQVPEMPFSEIAGNTGGIEFSHSGPIAAKVGVISMSITISRVAVDAHCPKSGVKVYVVVPATEVLISGGLQLPVIPLVEVAGKRGGTEF